MATKTVTVNIRITDNQCYKLDEIATWHEVTRTDLMRQYILTGMQAGLAQQPYQEDLPDLRKAMKLELADIKAMSPEAFDELSETYEGYREEDELDYSLYPKCPIADGTSFDTLSPEELSAWQAWYSLPLADFCEDLRLLGLTLFLRRRTERDEARQKEMDEKRLLQFAQVQIERKKAAR
jgi:hypothetical protein